MSDITGALERIENKLDGVPYVELDPGPPADIHLPAGKELGS